MQPGCWWWLSCILFRWRIIVIVVASIIPERQDRITSGLLRRRRRKEKNARGNGHFVISGVKRKRLPPAVFYRWLGLHCFGRVLPRTSEVAHAQASRGTQTSPASTRHKHPSKKGSIERKAHIDEKYTVLRLYCPRLLLLLPDGLLVRAFLSSIIVLCFPLTSSQNRSRKCGRSLSHRPTVVAARREPRTILKQDGSERRRITGPGRSSSRRRSWR